MEKGEQVKRFSRLFVIYPGSRCTLNESDVLCIAPNHDFNSKPTYETLVPINTVIERLLHPENGIQWGDFTPQPGKSPIFIDTISGIKLFFRADPTGKIILFVDEKRPNPHIDIHTEELNPRRNISASSPIQVWPAISVPEIYRKAPAYLSFVVNQIVFTGEYIETPDPLAQYR